MWLFEQNENFQFQSKISLLVEKPYIKNFVWKTEKFSLKIHSQ